MNRIEGNAELVGNKAIGVDLQTLGPLGARLCPGGQLVCSTHLAQTINQNSAHIRIFSVNLSECRWTATGKLFTGLMKEGGRNALRIHTETFGLRSGIAGKEFVRYSTLAGHSRNCLHLLQRVNDAGNLEVAPGVTSAATDSLVEQIE